MKLSEVIASVRGELKETKLVSVGPDEPLSSVAEQMRDHRIGAVVVVQGHKPVGMVTDRDLALNLGTQRVTPQDPVKRIMSSPVRTIPNGAGVFAATQCMRDGRIRRLPIVDDDGRLVGIVSLDDLMWLLGRELHNLADEIKHQSEWR